MAHPVCFIVLVKRCIFILIFYILTLTFAGKLHHHIVALQVSEGTAVRKLEASNAKVKKLQAQVLRLQRSVDERSQSLYHCQVASRNKARHLKATIQVSI